MRSLPPASGAVSISNIWHIPLLLAVCGFCPRAPALSSCSAASTITCAALRTRLARNAAWPCRLAASSRSVSRASQPSKLCCSTSSTAPAASHVLREFVRYARLGILQCRVSYMRLGLRLPSCLWKQGSLYLAPIIKAASATAVAVAVMSAAPGKNTCKEGFYLCAWPCSRCSCC